MRHLQDHEVSVETAATELGLSYTRVRALLAAGILAGGSRRVRRLSAKRPWSTAPSHVRWWVSKRALETFPTTHAGMLADLQKERALRRARRMKGSPVGQF